jgi:LacI family transcriptional regulator
MPTIIDIAKQAGVSFKTVSRVLNDESNVRPATREKVLEAAKALNYRTNTAARNLRSKRPKLIALLIDNPSQSYTQSVQLGALLGCQKHGLYLSLHSQSDKKTLTSLAENGETIGFILAPPMSDDKAVLRMLSKLGKPVIRLGTEHPQAVGIRISVDDKQAAFDITEHLIKLGHRRIGFIKGHVDYDAASHRYLGYKAALQARDIKVNDALVVQGDFSYASGLEATESLLALTEKPTAIFAANDEMAAGALAAAYKQGLRVPDTLSIAGFDDSPIATAVYPQLTTVRQSLADMVEKAVELLAAPQSEDKNTKIILEHALISRDSTGPVL